MPGGATEPGAPVPPPPPPGSCAAVPIGASVEIAYGLEGLLGAGIAPPPLSAVRVFDPLPSTVPAATPATTTPATTRMAVLPRAMRFPSSAGRAGLVCPRLRLRVFSPLLLCDACNKRDPHHKL